MKTKIALLVITLGLLAIKFIYFPGCPTCVAHSPSAVVSATASTTPFITIGGQKVNVLVSNTEAARERGLSDREELPPNTGMLFVFDMPTLPGFWMKDMKFDLDFIWIDINGQIIQVDKDISKETYPQIFRPNKAVKYVLEVPAGYAQGHQIDTGSEVYFSL